MASILDVADYILKELGPLPAMKLQKLVYYSQAWSLVWDDKPLFIARIEAWANGPVAPSLYARHRREYLVTRKMIGGDWRNLEREQRETIDAVIEHYGGRSSQWLSDLTHAEPPWRNARGDLPPQERGKAAISLADMAEYYGSLQ